MFGQVSDVARVVALSLSPSYLSTLEELEPEYRVYELRSELGVTLRTAFEIQKVLSGGGAMAFELSRATGLDWSLLNTGGGHFVFEALLPSALSNGGDRLWLAGDESLDPYGSPSSFGSRVALFLMAGGMDADEDTKDEYCVAESVRDSGGVFNESAGEFELSAAVVVSIVFDLLAELGVAA